MATWILLTAAGLAIWTIFYALVLSGLTEAHAQHDAYAKFREQLAQQTAPLGGAITPGAPVALITAPALGLHDVVVSEGTASGDLANGPGHRRDSVLPGQAGISLVYGRATLYGGPFGEIASARPGDSITTTTGQGVARFRVEDVRRVGDPYPPALAANEGRLTLVTSEGASVGDFWEPKRPVYVDARLIGPARPSPGVGVGVVPQAEKAMSSDPGSLFVLVLLLPLLLAVGVVIVWAVNRWGPLQAYLTGAPLLIGVLWAVTDHAVRLLPNLV